MGPRTTSAFVRAAPSRRGWVRVPFRTPGGGEGRKPDESRRRSATSSRLTPKGRCFVEGGIRLQAQTAREWRPTFFPERPPRASAAPAAAIAQSVASFGLAGPATNPFLRNRLARLATGRPLNHPIPSPWQPWACRCGCSCDRGGGAVPCDPQARPPACSVRGTSKPTRGSHFNRQARHPLLRRRPCSGRVDTKASTVASSTLRRESSSPVTAVYNAPSPAAEHRRTWEKLPSAAPSANPAAAVGGGRAFTGLHPESGQRREARAALSLTDALGLLIRANPRAAARPF